MKLKKLLKFCMLITCLGTLLFSCKKPPGEGGKASIRGTIWVEDWNSGFTVKNGEYAGFDRDVFIIYGNDVSYSDKTRANYNGEFEFKYLRKGKYKVYVYSRDKTLQSSSGEISIVNEIEIKEKRETIKMDTLTVYL
jgi:hypothetical protein